MKGLLYYNFKKDYLFLISFRLIVSTIIGDATNNEEYVPTITPTIKANINPLITSPPKRKIISSTKNVVKDVLIVLLNVEFNDWLINSCTSFFL